MEGLSEYWILNAILLKFYWDKNTLSKMRTCRIAMQYSSPLPDKRNPTQPTHGIDDHGMCMTNLLPYDYYQKKKIF